MDSIMKKIDNMYDCDNTMTIIDAIKTMKREYKKTIDSQTVEIYKLKKKISNMEQVSHREISDVPLDIDVMLDAIDKKLSMLEDKIKEESVLLMMSI